jgi:chromosome segregation ATPase
MIQEIFLKRAVNIRKEYISIKYDISSYEKNIRDILNALESKAVDLNELKTKLDENKIHDPEMAKSQLLKIMMELETEINTNETFINNLNKNIDKLKNDEVLLYRDIKQRYPEMNDSEIKNEVQEYIQKLNLS